MKAKLIGKNSIQITMTLNQLDSVNAALDSCSHITAYSESKAYSDIESVHNKLYRATEKAFHIDAQKILAKGATK